MLILSNGEDSTSLVPIDLGVTQALEKLAPHLAHAKHVRVLSDTRARVVSVQDEIIVKYGRIVRQVEADSMRFVAKHTSIPLPKLYGTYTARDGRVYIVMEYVAGQPIEDKWRSFSKREKEVLALELKNYLHELRSLSESYIGALGQKSCVCGALQEPFTGPFPDERQLNEALVKSYEQEKRGHFGSMLRNMLKVGHKTVFSHSDISMSNVLVREGKIVAILDWESAGFFPEYWEYAHACLGVRWADPELEDWIELLQVCLKPYPAESAVIEAISNAWMR